MTTSPPTYTLLAYVPTAYTAILGTHDGLIEHLHWRRAWEWPLLHAKYQPQPPLPLVPDSPALPLQILSIGNTAESVQAAYSPTERRWYTVQPQPQPQQERAPTMPAGTTTTATPPVAVLPPPADPLPPASPPAATKDQGKKVAWSPERRAAASAAAKARALALKKDS